MRRDDQASAIWQAFGLPLINEQFARYVSDLMRLAALAFNDDALLESGRLDAFDRWTPREWALVKGEVEQAVRESGLDAQAQREWQTAFEAVYRILGSSQIPSDPTGIL
jgi:hypothetical protein